MKKILFLVTGIPCAAAITIATVLNAYFGFFAVNVTWIKSLIFVPIAFVLMYLALRIARGGG